MIYDPSQNYTLLAMLFPAHIYLNMFEAQQNVLMCYNEWQQFSSTLS
jgi:hypothetical protein